MASFKRFNNLFLLFICVLTLLAGTACSSPDKKAGNDAKDIKAPRIKTIISSYPKGASVSFNGQPMGVTPFTIMLPDKKRIEIKLELADHWTHTEELEQPFEGWHTALAYRLRRRVR